MDESEAANGFGDIVKLSILSTSIEKCYELGLFVRGYNLHHTKPLLAVGMGAHGQLSRITSPVSLVTHPLITFPSAPGQLSLAQVHEARHLMGLLPKQEFFVLEGGTVAETAVAAIRAGLLELGLPHACNIARGAASKSQDTLDISSPSGGLDSLLAAQFTKWTCRSAGACISTKCSLEQESVLVTEQY